MPTKMAVSQPWHFGSRRKLPKSEWTHLARRHICPHGQADMSGKETHSRYLPTCQISRVCRVGPPRLLGKLHTCQQGCQAQQPCTTHRPPVKSHTWQQGCQDIYRKDTEGWSTPLSRYNWGRLQTTAETAELHTPEYYSRPRRSLLASAAWSSALLDWGLHLPCCPPGSGDPSL